MKRMISWRLAAAMSLAVVLPLIGHRLRTVEAQQPSGADGVPVTAPPVEAGRRFGAYPAAPGGNPGGNSFYVRGIPAAADPLAEADHRALAEQDAETRRLVSEYRQTEDERVRDRISKELPAIISKQFDIRQEARERELKQLEEQVRKLRELHARRAKQKDQIVDDRVRHLLRDADGLGWGNEESPHATSLYQPIGGNFAPSRVAPNPQNKPGPGRLSDEPAKR